MFLKVRCGQICVSIDAITQNEAKVFKLRQVFFDFSQGIIAPGCDNAVKKTSISIHSALNIKVGNEPSE